MSSKLYGVASALAGLLLIINTSCLAASANDGGQFSSLRLVGNVFCDTCFRQQFSTNSYFISGASVAVQCRTNKQQKADFRLEAKTNEYGEFKFELPPSIFHSHEQVQRCSTTLLKNPQGSCKVASMAKSSSFSLKSKQGGGTFALYSLLCRHANLNLLPNRQPLDAQLSTYKVSGPRETALSRAIKSFFEKHQIQRIGLLLLVMLGTCLVIGDGVLTPTISVLSAVQGIKVKADLDDRYIVLIACVILVGLFALQHFGTRKVGFLFAPIVIAWLLCISSIGIYNIIRWNPTVFRAISPYYMFNFFRKTKVDGWESLGGIVLCITGAEAMFADLGHFSQLSIKIAFTGVVYPCLILAYMGDAAFLSKHKGDLQRSFYMSIPEAVFWPVFVVATLAAVVGSQAVISATFSIINQCSALSCFPRVITPGNYLGL